MEMRCPHVSQDTFYTVIILRANCENPMPTLFAQACLSQYLGLL